MCERRHCFVGKKFVVHLRPWQIILKVAPVIFYSQNFHPLFFWNTPIILKVYNLKHDVIWTELKHNLQNHFYQHVFTYQYGTRTASQLINDSRKVHVLIQLVILNVIPIILALFSNKLWPLLFSNYLPRPNSPLKHENHENFTPRKIPALSCPESSFLWTRPNEKCMVM